MPAATVTMVEREAVLEALLALLQTTGSYPTVSRRNRDPNAIKPAECPALMLLEVSERYIVKAPNLPRQLVLMVSATFYNDVGTNQSAIPTTVINKALDAFDRATLPQTPDGLFTLGGLVYSCRANGEVKKAPGDMTGKAIAIVPIEIIMMPAQ